MKDYIFIWNLQIFCLKEDEFPNTRAYDDYLEKIENIVFNLVEGIDVEQTEAEIARFKEQNMEAIERNRKKPSADDLWIKKMLDEETERQKRVTLELNNENNQAKKKTAEDMTKEVLEELKTAGLPAEVIVDRRRKQQIEQEILSRDEEKKKKVIKLGRSLFIFLQLMMIFSTSSGKSYVRFHLCSRPSIYARSSEVAHQWTSFAFVK